MSLSVLQHRQIAIHCAFEQAMQVKLPALDTLFPKSAKRRVNRAMGLSCEDDPAFNGDDLKELSHIFKNLTLILNQRQKHSKRLDETWRFSANNNSFRVMHKKVHMAGRYLNTASFTIASRQNDGQQQTTVECIEESRSLKAALRSYEQYASYYPGVGLESAVMLSANWATSHASVHKSECLDLLQILPLSMPS